jgi:hypothetical protein
MAYDGGYRKSTNTKKLKIIEVTGSKEITHISLKNYKFVKELNKLQKTKFSYNYKCFTDIFRKYKFSELKSLVRKDKVQNFDLYLKLKKEKKISKDTEALEQKAESINNYDYLNDVKLQATLNFI